MAERTSRLRRAVRVAAPFLAGWLTLAGVAHAQAMSTNSASFNGGYGRTPGSENQPINVATSDGNGNITLINGVLAGVQQGSVFANAGAFAGVSASAGASASGVGDGFIGTGGATSSAIGNNLSVVTQGNNNVVIVNSVQSNTGDITAITNVNGKP